MVGTSPTMTQARGERGATPHPNPLPQGERGRVAGRRFLPETLGSSSSVTLVACEPGGLLAEKRTPEPLHRLFLDILDDQDEA